MIDYLVAVAIALAGLLIMWFMFNNVETNASSFIKRKAHHKNRHPREKKTHISLKKKHHNEEIDEIDKLIEQELLRNPVGMSVDSNNIQPKTLDLNRKPHENKKKLKDQLSAEEVTENQSRIDKELGFQTVQPRTRRHRVQKQATNDEANSEDDMERKLSNFFRNGGHKSALNAKLTLDDDNTVKSTGGRVTIKRDIGNVRSW